MKFLILFSLLLLQSLVSGSPIGANPQSALHNTSPSLVRLCTVNITTAAVIPVGVVKTYTIFMIPITGGTFSGPKLKGKILPVGFDLASTSADGVFTSRGKLMLQTDDGNNIYLEDTGFAPSVRASFLAGPEPYEWLNDVVSVGKTEQTKTAALLTLYQVL